MSLEALVVPRASAQRVQSALKAAALASPDYKISPLNNNDINHSHNELSFLMVFDIKLYISLSRNVWVFDAPVAGRIS